MRKNTIITILLVALIGLSGCAGILGGGDGAGTKTNTTDGTPVPASPNNTTSQPTQSEVINQTVETLGETSSVSYSLERTVTSEDQGHLYTSEGNGTIATTETEFLASSQFENVPHPSGALSVTSYRNSSYSYTKATRPESKKQINVRPEITNITQPIKYEVGGRIITNATLHNGVFTNDTIESATFRNESTEFTVSDVPEEEFYYYVPALNGSWTARGNPINSWNDSQMGIHRSILQSANEESLTYQYNGETAIVEVKTDRDNIAQLYNTVPIQGLTLIGVEPSAKMNISYRIDHSDGTIERATIRRELPPVGPTQENSTAKLVIRYDQYNNSSVTIPPAVKESAEPVQPPSRP